MWTPDVYEGSPTPVTAFFATAPKVAAMGSIARVMIYAFGPIAGLAALSPWRQCSGGGCDWAERHQTPYGLFIAHMGFALMGLAADAAQGVQAMMIYMAIYVTMNVGTFAFIMSMERDGRPVTDIAALNHYAKREPGKALAMLILMFSLAGVPPLLGFFGKFGVLQAAVDADMTWLALAGAVASVIGAFYYLRIVFFMYFSVRKTTASTPIWARVMADGRCDHHGGGHREPVWDACGGLGGRGASPLIGRQVSWCLTA